MTKLLGYNLRSQVESHLLPSKDELFESLSRNKICEVDNSGWPRQSDGSPPRQGNSFSVQWKDLT